jgi:hypothetical protein
MRLPAACWTFVLRVKEDRAAMTPIPVICDSCGRVWFEERIFGVAEGATASVTLANVTVGPCPYCRGTGHVPDGLWELRSNAAHYLGGLGEDELRKLLAVVRDAQQHTLDADIVAARIEHEVPSASPLAGLVKNSGTALAAWLTLLVALLQLLIPLARPEKSLSAHEIEAAVTTALEHVRDETKQVQPRRPQPTEPKPGRNDPCWCGSGKKYKHCHGR